MERITHGATLAVLTDNLTVINYEKAEQKKRGKTKAVFKQNQ
jgi:hypothetical protein